MTVSFHLNNKDMVTRSDVLLEKMNCCWGCVWWIQPPLHQTRCSWLVSLQPAGSQSSSGIQEDTLPLMKLMLSRPLASQASHWPSVSSRGGSSDGGEGYGFSVTVCALRGGAKSGSGAAGFILAQTWPRFGPDQHHNLHVSKLTD